MKKLLLILLIAPLLTFSQDYSLYSMVDQNQNVTPIKGDAHSDDGFCNAIRDAKIQGQIVNDKYILTYFKLIDN